MSPQQQDASGFGRPRQRANTTSFASSFGWRRHRSDQVTPSPVNVPPATQQPLSLDALIDALKPPAVPSLAYARALAGLLGTASPSPRCAVIQPILASLCDVSGPLSFQAAGFDILSSYWENPEAVCAETADRLSFFSLFLGSAVPWAADLWEPRFKALRAFTKYGTDIVGIETALTNLLKWWLEGAFDGLLKCDGDLDRSERAERERSVDVLVKFLSDVLNKPENIARLPENTVPLMIDFYASLVDRSIVTPKVSDAPNDFSTSSDSVASQPRFGLHRRNPSSLSTSSLASPTTPTPPSMTQSLYKTPAEIAITIYLDYFQTQIKMLSPSLLENIMPLLFRALASCASPLPRLTVLSQPLKKSSLEDRILETLISIYTGPYSTNCVGIHRRCLFPEFPLEYEAQAQETEAARNTSDDSAPLPIPQKIPWIPLQLGILTTLGGYRMMRIRLRHILITRLARAYIQRETSIGYSHSGAPSHIDVEQELMEKAWPRDDYIPNVGIGIGSVASGWDPRRVGSALAESVASWIDWIGEGPHTPSVIQPDRDSFRENWDRERNQADRILEEAAGILKDLLQEADSREDDNSSLNDEEAAFVGGILFSLCKYVTPLRQVRTPSVSAVLTPAIAEIQTVPRLPFR